MYQLSSKDFLKIREEPLTRAERDKNKELQKKAEQYSETMKTLMMEFFNEKIVPTDIPISLIEEYMFTYFRASLAIYKTKSKEWREYLEAKEKFELSPIKDLNIENENNQNSQSSENEDE